MRQELRPLSATDLWHFADLLWRFHQTHQHGVNRQIMEVHTAVVDEAEARDAAFAARKAAK